MRVTKKKFCEIFEYKSLPSVSNLLRKGKIVADDDGLINLENKKNKNWAKKRNAEIKNQKIVTEENSATAKNQKDENQLALEINILNQKLLDQQKKSTLLDLKIAKEKKDVIETDVLNRVIMTTFNSLFQNLSELPNIYADEIVNIVKAEKNAKQQLVKFLTEKIITHIRSGLEVAENTANKYYEQQTVRKK